MKLIDLAFWYVETVGQHSHVVTLDDTNDWHATMEMYGINRKTQLTIMDPEFMDIRLPKPCSIGSSQHLYCGTGRLRG